MDNALYQNKPREIDPYQEWASQTDYNKYFDYNKANAEINAQTQEAQPQPIYQPAVDNTATKYNEFNSQINTQEAASTSTPATPPAPEQVWDEITSPFPEPKYDEKRQQRLKNIAKANALGKGLSALGDIFSLSQGGLVNRRENDGRIDRYNAMYQQYEDDYNRRMDQHNRDKINMYLQQLREKRSEDWRNKSWNFQTDQAAKNEEWRKEQNRIAQENRKEDKTESRERWEKSVEMQDIDNKRQQEYQNWQMNKYAEEKALKDLENLAGGKGTGKQYGIFTKNGKKISLDGDNEKYHVLNLIMKDKAIPQEGLDLLKPKMGQPVSTNAIDMLIANYWEYSPLTVQYINQKYGSIEEPGKEPEKSSNDWLKGIGVTQSSNPVQAAQPKQNIPVTEQTVNPTQEEDTKPMMTLPGMENRKPKYDPNNATLPGLKIQSDAEIDTSSITVKYPEHIRGMLTSMAKTPYAIAQEMAKGQGLTTKQEYDNYVRQMTQQITQDRATLKDISRTNTKVANVSNMNSWASENPGLAEKYLK